MFLSSKVTYISVVSFFLTLLLIAPMILFAAVQGGQEPSSLLPDCEGADCDFNDLMQLANNIMKFIIMIAIPLTAIIFSYAGFLYITAAGNEHQIAQAHDIFVKVAIGFFFILAAWLIVYLITSTLLKPDYINVFPSSR